MVQVLKQSGLYGQIPGSEKLRMLHEGRLQWAGHVAGMRRVTHNFSAETYWKADSCNMEKAMEE
jgi:hypothetical protein